MTKVKHNPNPTGKGGFGDHPEHIESGPKPRTDISIIKHMLKRLGSADEKEAQEIAKTFVKRAKDGDFKFAKEIIDRIDGVNVKKVELTGKDGNPVALEVSSKECIEIFEKFAKLTKDVYGRKISEDTK